MQRRTLVTDKFSRSFKTSSLMPTDCRSFPKDHCHAVQTEIFARLVTSANKENRGDTWLFQMLPEVADFAFAAFANLTALNLPSERKDG